MSNWIYPFRGRNRSLSFDQNFVWRKDNIYIMDNHRAALWCWLQHLSPEGQHGVFHIDAHYDMAQTLSESTLNLIPELDGMSLSDYLELMQPFDDGDDFPIIRWDNYLTLFELKYRDKIGDFFTATHKMGSKPPNTVQWEEVEIHRLPEIFSEFLSDYGHSGWILNIDLDYFFTKMPEYYSVFVSESYLNEIFSSIKSALDKDLISVLTICLSPECTGGWKNSEEICAKLCKTLEIDFKLPNA